MSEIKSNHTKVNTDIFLTQFSDLSGNRWDPYYYKTEFAKFRQKLEDQNFIPLRKIIKSWNRGDGPRDGFYTDDALEGVFFLRVNNLKDHSIDLTGVKFINRHIHEGKLKRTQVTDGDLIFAISGTKDNLGTVSIIPEGIHEANLNSALVRLDIDETVILKEFFCFMFDLDFVQYQIDFIGKGAAQNNLNNEEISQIRLPQLSIAQQRNVIEFLQKAKEEKQKKEEEARALLDSIDDYLLGELGISIPNIDVSTIEDRIFKTPFRNVSGQRFDAPIYHRKLKLNSPHYASRKILDVVQMNPYTSFARYSQNTLATFIPMDKVSDQYGEAFPEEVRPVSLSGGYTKFIENDLIWAKITPCMQNGKSAVARNLENRLGFGSTEFHVFRAQESVSIDYIHALLRLESLREHAKLYFSGSAGHQRVSDEFFRELAVPIPPYNKQLEIVKNIQGIRQEAKQSYDDSAKELAQAKQEIEKLILGH